MDGPVHGPTPLLTPRSNGKKRVARAKTPPPPKEARGRPTRAGKKQPSPPAAAALFTLSAGAKAAVTITNFKLTTTTVSFNIDGTMPNGDSLSPRTTATVYLVNPDLDASPGFSVDRFKTAKVTTFTGTRQLQRPTPATGNTDLPLDYAYISFVNVLAGGEAISGNFDASWTTTPFDPSAVSALEIYWGKTSQADAPNTGVLLATVPVPEPSATLLLGSDSPPAAAA